MKSDEPIGKILHCILSSLIDYRQFLKTVTDEDLKSAGVTLRMSEADVKQRLKSVNAESRRR